MLGSKRRMDLPRSRAETKSAAWAQGQVQQPKGSQTPQPIYCFISNMFADLEKRGGVGQGGDSWVPTSLPLVEADTFCFIHSPPAPHTQQLFLRQDRAGPRLTHPLPTVCSMTPEHLWEPGKMAWGEKGRSINKAFSGLSLGCLL